MSALLWRGTPHQLLEAICQRPSVQVGSSAALLEELTDVLTRPAVTKRLALISKTAHEVRYGPITSTPSNWLSPCPFRAWCPTMPMTIK